MYSAVKRQTAVTAYFSSKQLLLSVFATMCSTSVPAACERDSQSESKSQRLQVGPRCDGLARSVDGVDQAFY